MPASPERGFTLTELMISLLIFSLVMLAVLFLFDQGQAMYTRAEQRSILQENLRLALETMEREVRMLGFGVPSGSGVGGSTGTWVPALFAGTSTSISFRGDIDNGYQPLTGATNTENLLSRLHVGDITELDARLPGTIPVVVTEDKDTWQGLTYNSTGTTYLGLTGGNAANGAFSAANGEVFTIEHVFYRHNATDGTIERQILFTNAPTTTASGTWEVIATGVETLLIEYYAGTTKITNDPLVAGDLPAVTKVGITITTTGRGGFVGTTQSVTLRAESLLRNVVL